MTQVGFMINMETSMHIPTTHRNILFRKYNRFIKMMVELPEHRQETLIQSPS